MFAPIYSKHGNYQGKPERDHKEFKSKPKKVKKDRHQLNSDLKRRIQRNDWE